MKEVSRLTTENASGIILQDKHKRVQKKKHNNWILSTDHYLVRLADRTVKVVANAIMQPKLQNIALFCRRIKFLETVNRTHLGVKELSPRNWLSSPELYILISNWGYAKKSYVQFEILKLLNFFVNRFEFLLQKYQYYRTIRFLPE